MQPKNKIFVFNFLPIFGWVVLLCLAPCSIRNLIQHELESPLTKLFNKNQTTINSATCSVSEIDILVVSTQYSKHIPLHLFESESDLTPYPQVYNKLTDFAYSTWDNKVETIPYYILYKNFKDYL